MNCAISSSIADALEDSAIRDVDLEVDRKPGELFRNVLISVSVKKERKTIWQQMSFIPEKIWVRFPKITRAK